VVRKKDTNFALPNDVGGSFEEEDFILNYRPTIEFVEPPQEAYEFPEEISVENIDNLRDRTQKLINGLDTAVKLADLAQKRVDERVVSAGGFISQLDPVKDAQVIAAMKRRFPDKTDPTKITYDEYKEALSCLQQSAVDAPAVSTEDIKAAQADPYRTDFGGKDNQEGQNRAELSSPASSVSPIDLEAFQKAGILALFALMLPLIKIEDTKEVVKHLATAPHKPA